MLSKERQEVIVQTVRTERAAGVSELADRLEVSEMTIRRDLELLASEGKLVRVHGGALPPEGGTFSNSLVRAFPQKDRIGAAAAAVVEDGESILLDLGTTTAQVARHLRGRPVTVITCNLVAHEELLADSTVELILLGGAVDRHYRSLVGFLAEEALRQLRADRAFIGASGIREDLSVLDDTNVDMRIKRGMIEAASDVSLVADASKFGRGNPAKVCGPDELNRLITDKDAPSAVLADFEEAGVEVMQV